jgi:hypothetical protein
LSLLPFTVISATVVALVPIILFAVALIHTPETLNCELIVNPEEVQLINWQLHV